MSAPDAMTLRRAAQAIAGARSLDDLARSALRSFVDCAGAARGVLLLAEAREARAEGFHASLVAQLDLAAPAERERVTVRRFDEGEPGATGGVPLAVLEQVARTGAPVVVDDLALGAPLVAQPARGLVGLVYLEAAGAGAFTAERREAVELIAVLVVAAIESARAYDALALRLDERTRLLAEAVAERDDAAQRVLAQERLASLGMIASGVAHEIKNPLNFVNNFAELSVGLTEELGAELARRAHLLPAESAAYLGELAADLQQNAVKIREHGKRADGIVRDMLQHSRGRAGQAREVDFNALVDEHARAASEAQTAPAPLRAKLALEPDRAMRPLRVVPEEMGRVVLNLVNNALDAARARRATQGEGFTPAVTVTTRDLGDRVEVRVRDNGGGIPEAIQARIYRPFFTTKPTGEGTGLGLSLSRDIVVERHGGEIGFSCREGESTEFVVTIPRRAAV